MNEQIPPPKLWVQLYAGNSINGRIGAYEIDPREAHDNGKPIYQYGLITESSDELTFLKSLREQLVDLGRDMRGIKYSEAMMCVATLRETVDKRIAEAFLESQLKIFLYIYEDEDDGDHYQAIISHSKEDADHLMHVGGKLEFDFVDWKFVKEMKIERMVVV